MFIGHFAIGMGTKAMEPKVSLGLLFMAAQFLDLLWPSLLLLGIERVEISPGITNVAPLDFVYYPFSHSLLMVLGWGFLFGSIYFLFTKNRKTAFILGLLVVSHWFLDLIVHRPDLPLSPGLSVKAGLGLWYSHTATLVVESLLFITAAYIYIKRTKPKNKTGSYSLWSLLVFLVLIHVANFYGPVPGNVSDIAWAGQLQWILVIWGFWIDKNRFSIFHRSPGISKAVGV